MARRRYGLGVDAAGKHGWVGVVVGDEGLVGLHLGPRLVEVIAAAELRLGVPVDAIGVDIPIGLVDAGQRAADAAAKAFVGIRRSSVFWAPHRSAIGFDDQAEANEHLASIGMPKVSAQAFGLFPRIREAAEVAATDERLVEVFPEASFRRLAGSDLPAAKRSAAGALHRLRLLAGADPAIVLPHDPAALGPAGRVPLDDLFDAAAAAWSAHRVAHGRAESHGDPAELDPVTGRRIAMWV